MWDNIFSPSFGNKPRNLIGRSNEMRALLEGLSSPPGSKERARLIIGQRGMGKTVLLLELAEYAKEHDYIVASPTVVSADMLDRILEKLGRDEEKKARISGGSVGILGFSAGIQTEKTAQPTRSFAYQLQDICDYAEKAGKGVLILVDEVQSGSEQLQKLIIAYQEMVGEGHNIAITLAGLPSAIAQTLNEHVLTFLNRASKMYLEPISIAEIQIFFKESFRKLGIRLSDSEIAKAAEQTGGSPYMMQLIGHYLVVSASDDGELSPSGYENAITIAKKEFIDDICKTTISPLSERDMDFLLAMSKDEAETSMKDICDRLEVGSAYANRYKLRLIQSGVIVQRRRGYVEFAVPYLKDYLASISELS